MLASTSRVLRCSLPASRQFSTSAVRAKREAIVVELLHDVPGLGLKFDRVPVTEGRMRHELVPFRLARYIPWKKASEKAEPFLQQRARPGPSDQTLLGTPTPDAASQASTPSPTPQSILDALHLLPPSLTFSLRTISPTTPALHGSLTLSDVQELLAAQHGLSSRDVEAAWLDQEAGARMKELGTWAAVVRVREHGREEVPIQIEVERLV